MKTPEQRRKELEAMGLQAEEVELLVKAHTAFYRIGLSRDPDVMKTEEALRYINGALELAKVAKMKKDRLTLTNLRDLTVKPNMKGNLVGRIQPVDPHAPKKIGFHFKKEELDKFIRNEIKLRKTTKEELFKENERLRAQIAELEARLNTQKVIAPVTDKESESELKDVSLSPDMVELTFTYKNRTYYATFDKDDNFGLTGIQRVINSDGDTRDVVPPPYDKLAPLAIEAWERKAAEVKA